MRRAAATTYVVPPSSLARRTLLTETALVLGVSLGASAVWSILSIVRRLTDRVALSAQTSTMNNSVTPDRPWLDLAYQLAGIGLALVPVGLALHLLARDGVPPGALGLSRRTAGGDVAREAAQGAAGNVSRDVVRGVALAALVGIPGLGFYLAARALGANTTVAAANLAPVWWAVPVLILAAAQNAVLEEVVMIGYLLTRWRQAGCSAVAAVVGSAVIRGTYHLYQGFGGFLGNLAMGLLFGWLYTRRPRVGPLIVAHTLLDVVAFVGYAALRGHVSWL
jgi:membrane protease YdiL (CAAX protease family)